MTAHTRQEFLKQQKEYDMLLAAIIEKEKVLAELKEEEQLLLKKTKEAKEAYEAEREKEDSGMKKLIGMLFCRKKRGSHCF